MKLNKCSSMPIFDELTDGKVGGGRGTGLCACLNTRFLMQFDAKSSTNACGTTRMDHAR